jgi:hypothetical protein
MKRSSVTALALLLGCGADPAPRDPVDTGVDAVADGSQSTDTGAPGDTGGALDSGAVDAVPTDTAMMDTTALDTLAMDSARDTAVVDTATVDTTTADTAPAAEGGVLPYPAGPYGNREGQVLADLRLDGYVNLAADRVSTELPFVQTSMAALRGRGRGYGLVHLSEVF